jgi:AcrR family transcriptional regulator
MYFGRNHGQVEEELYKLASRCGSLRQMADELGIPHGTFWRHLGKEENREIRESIEGIVSSRQDIGTGHEDRWWIEDDYYLFQIRTLEHPYRIHRNVWSEIVWSYSRAGGDLTKAEVAREFDIPRPYLERALVLYGHFKASMPYLREEVEKTEDMEGLAERTLERKEHDYYLHLQEKEIHHLRREVQRYHEREYRHPSARHRSLRSRRAGSHTFPWPTSTPVCMSGERSFGPTTTIPIALPSESSTTPKRPPSGSRRRADAGWLG